MMKYKWLYFLLAIVALLTIRIADPWLVEILRLKSLDAHQRNQEQVLLSNILTVEIDEAALETYGQWPWSRDILAEKIKHIYDAGATLVVVPILFSEEDRFGKDEYLRKVFENTPVIIAQSASQKGRGTPVPRGVSVIGGEWNNYIFNYGSAIGPLALLGDVAAGVGMLLTAPEADGVVRRLPLVVAIDNDLYPSIPMEILRVLADDPSYQMKINEGGVEALRIPSFKTIKTDSNARIWVNFKYAAPSISLDNSTDMFMDKIVFLALTAEGLGTTTATPVGIKYGHDLVISAVATLIDGDLLERPFWTDFAELAYIATLAIAVCLIVTYLPWVYGIASILIALTGTYYLSYAAFIEKNLLIDWSWPVVTLILSWSIAAFIRFVYEFKQKMQIKKQFGTYLSPDLVARLQRQPELLKLGGETVELSIMFTDVRGFTTISEHYGVDVQGLTQIMNRYMTAMTKKILENKGTLDKYIGDAQMAFWNAPIGDANHAKNAVKTALEMMESLNEFNNEISKEGIPKFGMGLGINTDSVVVGNMGSDQRFDYTCLGDGVNLAARLEGQSKSYGVKIILGPKTAKQVEDQYAIIELDKIAVKGKKIGVQIYTVTTNKDGIDNHQAYLAYYRAGNWKKSLEIIKSQIKTKAFNDELNEYYNIMKERIEYYSTHQPDNWDGTYVAKTK